MVLLVTLPPGRPGIYPPPGRFCLANPNPTNLPTNVMSKYPVYLSIRAYNCAACGYFNVYHTFGGSRDLARCSESRADCGNSACPAAWTSGSLGDPAVFLRQEEEGGPWSIDLEGGEPLAASIYDAAGMFRGSAGFPDPEKGPKEENNHQEEPAAKVAWSPPVVKHRRSLSTAGLPTDPAERKGLPLASGVLDYFPLALLEVARASQAGQEQHNPGKPLAWDRSKSGDESDALARHLLERGTVDSDGIRHSAKVAWRALALLQKELERAAGE